MTQLFHSTIPYFLDLIESNQVASTLSESFTCHFNYSPTDQEVNSWANSLSVLANCLNTPELLKAHIFLEMKMPMSSARCDVVLSGMNFNGQPSAVVIELKQWEAITSSGIRDNVLIGGRNYLHPAAQCRAYCEYLKYYVEAFTIDGLQLSGCSYLHNMVDQKSKSILVNPNFFGTLPQEYPVYFADDAEKLKEYLVSKVSFGDSEFAVTKLLEAKLHPSTKLLDVVNMAVQNNFEWRLLDEQLLVFNTIATFVENAKRTNQKSIVIVRGGPGTGKSVLAIQLLAYGARQHWRVSHACGSKAFITVLQAQTQRLTNDFLKKIYNHRYKKDLPVKEIFTTAKNIADIGAMNSNQFDLVVVDEAHRLWDFRRRKFRGMNLKLSDTPMIEELVNATHVTAFFLDDNQSVRADEIGSVEYIENNAKRLGIHTTTIDLNIQFRCNGSESYIGWIDHVLGYSDNSSLAWRTFDAYDFKIMDSMQELQQALDTHQQAGNKVRILAGFCWPWSEIRPNGTLENDVSDPRFKGWAAPWIEKGAQDAPPSDSRYYKWSTDDTYYSQVGSIYSVQGFEFEYVGLIVGEDLLYRSGSNWTADLDKNKDNSFKSDLKKNREDAAAKLRNIYRVLLTRGMKGTYVFFLDPETRRRFEQCLKV